MSYPGGKSGSGTYQTIINLIPPHERYIETHLGSGSIMRKKKPSPISIGVDADPIVVNMWHSAIAEYCGISFCRNTKNDDRRRYESVSAGDVKPIIAMGSLSVINIDAVLFLQTNRFSENDFIYVDPPYLLETRSHGKIYDFEYTTNQHTELLSVLNGLQAMIMISGYWSELYDTHLSKSRGWSYVKFEAMTRGGTMAEEVLWMNYRRPEILHDYSYVGNDFRDRDRIKKKRQRWLNKIASMPALERNAIIHDLNNYRFLEEAQKGSGS